MASLADALVQDLADHLDAVPVPPSVSDEQGLDRYFREVVRRYAQEKLPGAKVFTHGDTDEEKRWWTTSKALQNVTVYGHPNTSDIFISDPRLKLAGDARDGGLYIEFKFAKRRGHGGTSLPDALHLAIGQSIIASLRHPYVIALIVCQHIADPDLTTDAAGEERPDKLDRREALSQLLWQQHRIRLVVRDLARGALTVVSSPTG